MSHLEILTGLEAVMATRTHLSSNPLDMLRGINTHAIPRDYRNRQTIFVQGEKADAMFYIRSGHVKLTVVSNNRKESSDSRSPTRGFLWRRLSGETICADIDRNGTSGSNDRAREKECRCPPHP